MNSKGSLLTLFLIAILSFTAPAANAQCAMCRATVSSNVQSKESKVGSGLNNGILYLMTIPYVLVGTVGFVWYSYNRSQKKKNK